ncbi:MAG: HAD family hydrolase [Deltaproteobacteria bacterium]
MSRKIKLNFKAVIFDMDGVITNTMPYHFDAWLETFKKSGIRVNCYDVYEREGQDGSTSVREIFQKYGRRYDPAEARRILAYKEKLFKRIVKIKFIKGSRPFIRMLKKRKFRLALVTGTSRHEMQKILPRSLRGSFEAIITGDEVKKGKPDPGSFLKALRMLKIQAKDAFVLENAPFGIEAAKKAGLFCVALETSLPKKYLSRADRIFGSYEKLKEALNF